MEVRHLIHQVTESVKVGLELGRETTPHIDAQFMAIANREASKPGAFFGVVGEEQLQPPNRPDAINHNLTLLPPNALNNREINEALSLVDIMLGTEQTAQITEKFAEAADEVGIFDRLQHDHKRQGAKLIVLSNHLELPDQGFTMGFLHKAAAEHGVERLENYLTAVIGRVVGYFTLGETNVIDGILRRAGSILKTFPRGGSEALTEDEEFALALYRGYCNHKTKEAFSDLMSTQDGRIVTIAPSGEQDHFDAEEGTVKMRAFGDGTCNMIIDACKRGAMVLPVFVDYSTTSSIVEFLEPRTTTSTEDCHAIGQELAAVGTDARAIKTKELPEEKRYQASISYSSN